VGASAGDVAGGGTTAAGVGDAASAAAVARLVPVPVQRNMVELADVAPAVPPARPAAVAPATPAIVAGTGDTRIRYWPEQNMVELLDAPVTANAGVNTSAMGAAPAVGQPVRQPSLDVRPLQPRLKKRPAGRFSFRERCDQAGTESAAALNSSILSKLRYW
jgi:hypothetical protein